MDICCINLSISFLDIVIYHLESDRKISTAKIQLHNQPCNVVTIIRVLFKGKVQGVFFRANCQKKAVELGLNGMVRNLENGDVESIVQGPRDIIDQFIEWNRTSQPHAQVYDMKVTVVSKNEVFDHFSILE